MNALAVFRSKPPAEQIKLALVPVLVIGLGALLLGRFTGSPSNGSVDSLAAGQLGVAVPGVSKDAGRGIDETAATVATPWKLEDVIALNPFRRPPKPAAEMEIEPTDDVQMVEDEPNDGSGGLEDDEPASPARPPRRWPAKVQAVFVDERGAAAIVDSRVVHLGDVLENGARVVEISATAVTFELGGAE